MENKFAETNVLGVGRLSHYSIEFAVYEVSSITSIGFISHAKIHVVQYVYKCFNLRVVKCCSCLVHQIRRAEF